MGESQQALFDSMPVSLQPVVFESSPHFGDQVAGVAMKLDFFILRPSYR